MTHIVRNTMRVLRGLFIFRVFMIAFTVGVLAIRWSVLSPPEALKALSPSTVLFMLPSLATMLYLFLPGLQKRVGKPFLPIALIMSIVALSIDYGVAYLYPGASVRVTLPTGREINLVWASTEMILLTLVPCVLAGAVYGIRGALQAATLATTIHLALGAAVWMSGRSLHGFLLLLPLRIAVLYAFPLISGYLADTWRHEHQAVEQANRQLRGYAATVEHLATSRERVRLARAMHDTLAHSLSALIIQFEAVEALQETDPAAAYAHLERLKQQARAGLDETRQAIMDLRSSPVEELGLASALEQLASRFSQRNGLQVNWSTSGERVPLLPAQANALYRIAEEALDNVEHHAGASQVSMHLSYADGVTLSIQDNGQGFDPAAVDPRRYGLVGIYERAALVEGQVRLDSASSQGTALTVQIPEPWGG